MRHTLNKFQDKDYDKLLTRMNNKKIKQLLLSIDRDKNPLELLLKAGIAEPRLALFAKFLLPTKRNIP